MEKSNIRPIQKHFLAVVPVKNAASKKVKFPDLNTLKDKKIVSIEAHNINDVTIGPDGETIVSDVVFKKSYLVLKSCGKENQIDRLPLNALYTKNNDGKIKEFAESVYDYAGSTIEIGELTGVVAETVFLISFYYED